MQSKRSKANKIMTENVFGEFVFHELFRLFSLSNFVVLRSVSDAQYVFRCHDGCLLQG